MNIGHQIKTHRKELNLSQSQLAEKIYVSSQTISNWENERSYPDIHNLIALSALFNTSLDQLVKGDVVEMKNYLDQSNMDKYGWLMMGFMLACLVSIGPVIKYDGGYFGLIIPFIFWAVSMFYALKIERLKKKYDTQTFKEIIDFMETGNINTKQRNKSKYFKEKFLIVIVFTAVSALIAIGSIYLFTLI